MALKRGYYRSFKEEKAVRFVGKLSMRRKGANIIVMEKELENHYI
jgi:hypothetical protein